MINSFFVLLLILTSSPGLAKCRFTQDTASLPSDKGVRANITNKRWNVDVEKDGKISILDTTKKKSCTAEIDQVINRYWSDDETLVFEIVNAVENFLTFVNGETCKVSKTVSLPFKTEQRKKKILSLELCGD